ncbi:MAG: MFS transporter [Thiomargarita sp.]|nr:MFS transporter [Thiomargarita sp.]
MYWRLSAFYFFYFGSIGALLPYFGLYLKEIGFNVQAIGELTAIILATKIIAPNLVGWIADHTGRSMQMVRLSSFLSLLCFLGVFVGHRYLWLVLVLGSFSFFWNAVLPQFEATTFAHLGEQSERYSHIRLWGSIGFILVVGLFGGLFELISITLLPDLFMILLIGIALTSLCVPEKINKHKSTSTASFYQLIKQPSMIALFLSCFLLQVSHGPYYTFYSIYLEEYGYSRNVIGQLWALGVLAEILLFLVMHRLLMRFNLNHLLIITLGISSVRWLFIGYYIESLPMLILAQLMHAASFGMYHGVLMQFIRNTFTDQHQGKAQGLYSSLSFGAGGAVGSLVSGYTWNIGAQMTYLWASLVCILAMWISWRWVSIEIHK